MVMSATKIDNHCLFKQQLLSDFCLKTSLRSTDVVRYPHACRRARFLLSACRGRVTVYVTVNNTFERERTGHPVLWLLSRKNAQPKADVDNDVVCKCGWK